MHRSLFRFGMIGAAALTLAVGGLQAVRAGAEESAAKKHGPIPWTESLDGARKVAAKEKKVVMVDFWAEWCGPCKQMLATTYKDKTVVERAKKFVPVLVNVDKQQNLANKYSVESIPTVLFLDVKGKVLVRSVGYLGREDFLKLMDEAAKKAKS